MWLVNPAADQSPSCWWVGEPQPLVPSDAVSKECCPHIVLSEAPGPPLSCGWSGGTFGVGIMLVSQLAPQLRLRVLVTECIPGKRLWCTLIQQIPLSDS